MKRYMNEPENYTFTDEDVVKEYQQYNDIKRVAAVYCIDTKSVRQILKKEGLL